MEGTIGIEEGEEYNKNEWGRKGSGVLHPRGNLCPAPGGEEASCMGGDAVGEKNGSGFLSGGHRPDPRPAEFTYQARDEPVHEEGWGVRHILQSTKIKNLAIYLSNSKWSIWSGGA